MSSTSDLLRPDQQRPAKSAQAIVAVTVLTVAAAAMSFTCIQNSDIFWHLAAGKWMLAHGRILDFDPFSIDPEAQWINVHWLFQCFLAVSHKLGGFALLTVLKAALGAATVLVFGLSLRRKIPPGWLMVSGLFMLCVMIDRVRLRPELFTLLFVMFTVALTERVRRGGSARPLWAMVPLMLVWVNLHGLYILGLGILWSSLAGAWIDNRSKRPGVSGPWRGSEALAPALSATVAVLVSPWPVEGALHPLLLWTRISGQAFYYTYGVAELQRTTSALLAGHHMGWLVLVMLAAATMLANRKRLSVVHGIWLVVFVALGLLAKRNVGLTAPVLGYLLALHGGAVVRRLTAKRPVPSWVPAALTVCLAGAIIALSFAAGTSLLWAKLGRSQRFGPGLMQENYPQATAMFLADLPADGDLLCDNFGDAGTFLYHSYPKRRLFMDGRLEAHSQQRFIEQYHIATALRTPEAAEMVAIPPQVRFVFVRHSSGSRLAALARSRRFGLLTLDLAGACFVRRDWHGEPSPLPPPNFADFDRPLGRDGLINSFGANSRRIYAHNPPSRNYQLGTMLLALGQTTGLPPAEIDRPAMEQCELLAIRYLIAAQTENLLPADAVRGMLAKALLQKAVQENVAPSLQVPAEIHLAWALALYEQMDLTALADSDTRAFAQYHIITLKAAGQIERARQAVERFLKNLPPQQQVHPPQDTLQLRDLLQTALDRAEAKAVALAEQELPLLRFIERLAGPQIGLTERAMAELQAADNDDPQRKMLLGDLWLRCGQWKQAQDIYTKIVLPESQAWSLELRQALCLWIAGQLFAAADAMDDLSGRTKRPAVAYYHALLCEQLGWYDKARATLAQVTVASEELQEPVRRLSQRLARR